VLDDKNLTIRASSDTFPGWNYPPNTDLDVSRFLPQEAPLFVGAAALVACGLGCVSCLVSPKKATCCGCLCMRCVYRFDDIDNCPECDQYNIGGLWPGSGLLAKKKRQIGDAEYFEHEYEELSLDDLENRDLDDLEIYEEEREEYLVSRLEERGESPRKVLLPRPIGKATVVAKTVLVCNDARFAMLQPYKYPAFPVSAVWPWEGIQNGKWSAITRYYGNNSDICSDWGVAALQPADVSFWGTTPFLFCCVLEKISAEIS